MRPLFTVHAGEYLVGSEIEKRFKNLRVWIPSKDEGIDLLITDKDHKKSVAIQVKFSKDFSPGKESEFHNISSVGWFTLKRSKIKNSPAQLWIFVLYNFKQNKMQYVIIEPTELLKRYAKLHRKGKIIQSYFWISPKGNCWETRSLSKKDQIAVANDIFEDEVRNLTGFLNNWEKLKTYLRKK